jgi:hypothetical protein
MLRSYREQIDNTKGWAKMKTKKEFREYLNSLNDPSVNPHKNGKYQQRTRRYGDYLYHQDRDKFEATYREWLTNQN